LRKEFTAPSAKFVCGTLGEVLEGYETPTAGTAQAAGAHPPQVVPGQRAEDFLDPYMEEHDKD